VDLAKGIVLKIAIMCGCKMDLSYTL